MSKYSKVVKDAFMGLPKGDSVKVLSEYLYDNSNESDKVLVVYNSLRKRYEVMHDGVLVDSCLSEGNAQQSAEDYINEQKIRG